MANNAEPQEVQTVDDTKPTEVEVHHVSAVFDGRGFAAGNADPTSDPFTVALEQFAATVQAVQIASQQKINSLEAENADLRRRLSE